MKVIIVMLTCLLIGTGVFAQFSDSVHYYGKYASTGSINRTQDGRSYLLNNAFKLGVSKKRISLNGSGSWVYGQQDNSLTNNDFSAALDFDIYPYDTRRLYYWGLANYDKSISLKINDRFQAGGGAAYNFLDRKDAYLSLSDGILFENSDLFLQDTIRDVYHTFRNSLRVSYKWVIKEIFVIEGTHFLQNSLSHGNDYIIKSNSSLSIRLSKWLSITAAFNYNKVNRTQRENLLFTYGFTIEKYF